ncbi:hypothetical protein PT974_07626 [Cladobotryum mycophilum]|uniref:Type II secretion system protein GspF domain-containing protein n=1 Tax=Cladobotryum mycophilum TaxID=491253 RepID=A0ABR0SPR9_9HYPO
MGFTPNQLLCDLCGPSGDDYHQIDQQSPFVGIIDEKPSRHPQPYLDQPNITAEKLAADIVAILRKAEKRGEALTRDVNEVVSASGWSEWLAQNILKGIVHTLEGGRETMGSALAQAYDNAVAAAQEDFAELYQFVQEHPNEIASVAGAVLVTVLAFGVLVALTPFILELLGFSEIGSIEGTSTSSSLNPQPPTPPYSDLTILLKTGTFAAWWQSTYSGYVPKGSLFSYFQRLSMTWGRA